MQRAPYNQSLEDSGYSDVELLYFPTPMVKMVVCFPAFLHSSTPEEDGHYLKTRTSCNKTFMRS